jgi:uncharacterized membrane protein YqhA
MTNTKAVAMGMKVVFEGVIWQSRLIIVLAVVASLLSAIMMFVMAARDTFKLTLNWLQYLIQGGSLVVTDPEFDSMVMTQAIGGITDFLLAMLLFILGWGLYELFISKLSHTDTMVQKSSNILVIRNLDDLKDRMIKVVLLILVVQFFDYAINYTVSDALSFLYLGGGILMVSSALFLTYKTHSENSHK